MCKICYPAICCFFIYFPCCKEDKQMWASSQTWVTAPSCRLLQASVLFFFFFSPGQMGCSTYTQSTNTHRSIHKHRHPSTRCAPPLPRIRPPEVMVNCGSEKRKTNKQVRNATLKTHAKNNIYCSVDHPPCFHCFQLTISACSGSLKR